MWLVLFGGVLVGAAAAAAVVVLSRDRLKRAPDHHEDDLSALRQDLHDQHLDLERREHRLQQREERLDEVSHQLDERAAELAQQDDELTVERIALLDVAAERRVILERLAELTAEEAKAELVAQIVTDAKREAAVAARDIERTAHLEGGRTCSPHRRDRHPAAGLRADCRVGRLDGPAAR